MCTVTFLPNGFDGFVLTSNRDEAPNRETLAPLQYEVDEVKLVFPKDVTAGGTWIGVSSQNRLVCLLNGGFVPHERATSYRISRGIIVKKLLTSSNALAMIKTFDFNGIEPFTIILVDWKSVSSLHELVWDGKKTHLQEKTWVPHIWSSSLLYTEEVKQERETWFSEFLFKNLRPSASEILDFHTHAGIGNTATNLVMDRGFVKTKSMTQVLVEDAKATMYYQDLEQQQNTTIVF